MYLTPLLPFLPADVLGFLSGEPERCNPAPPASGPAPCRLLPLEGPFWQPRGCVWLLSHHHPSVQNSCQVSNGSKPRWRPGTARSSAGEAPPVAGGERR